MDIKLLAECVYSAKFVAEGQAKRLVDVVCDFVSEAEAEKIRHDAFLTDRIKTNNKSVLFNISTINEAMSDKVEGQPHIPEKITFKYLKYSIDDLKSQVERRHGEKYKVSPYKLLINDANYYLLAFDDKKQKMMTYRVDRMKDVSFTGEAREGDLVDRDKILRYLEGLGWDIDRLLIKGEKMRENENEYGGNLKKNGCKFVCSRHLVEQPVNILLSRDKLKDLSDLTLKWVI